jgi:hypothetical protein
LPVKAFASVTLFPLVSKAPPPDSIFTCLLVMSASVPLAHFRTPPPFRVISLVEPKLPMSLNSIVPESMFVAPR